MILKNKKINRKTNFFKKIKTPEKIKESHSYNKRINFGPIELDMLTLKEIEKEKRFHLTRRKNIKEDINKEINFVKELYANLEASKLSLVDSSLKKEIKNIMKKYKDQRLTNLEFLENVNLLKLQNKNIQLLYNKHKVDDRIITQYLRMVDAIFTKTKAYTKTHKDLRATIFTNQILKEINKRLELAKNELEAVYFLYNVGLKVQDY